MTDIVDPATRSRMMSGIRGKDTRPEMLVRKALHARGFRFRLHVKDLPGRPDIVLPKFRAVIFVHGCFWHGHDCRYFKVPQTRTGFWLDKIGKNQERDRRQLEKLGQQGWRVLVVWECAIRGHGHAGVEMTANRIADWLRQGAGPAQMDEAGIGPL
ncbi:very short patch repair endonuclease [Laribacter hongkongensis]|uniref:very short patch repair endonuclease n=1 Tax=Laribacter hongkongensis TaxID=168471 RepID=UPI001EFD2793|nr:DNA mismatch endonuclease Vsr [Laribacter hongkongensis]MCG9084115.1 DNA mismatch endonuclease Vsr [Laribacter hongkongensis]